MSVASDSDIQKTRPRAPNALKYTPFLLEQVCEMASKAPSMEEHEHTKNPCAFNTS